MGQWILPLSHCKFSLQLIYYLDEARREKCDCVKKSKRVRSVNQCQIFMSNLSKKRNKSKTTIPYVVLSTLNKQ